MKRILALSLLALALSAGAKDIKTVRFTTQPQMHCENCENRIKKNLRFEKGVKEIQTSVDQQTVTIKYDADKTTPKAIEQGFQKIGYKVRQLKDGEKVERDADAKCENM